MHAISVEGRQIVGPKLVAEGESSFIAYAKAGKQPLQPTFFDASSAVIDEACEKAAESFAVWKALSGTARAEFFEALAQKLQQHAEPLLERALQETSLPEPRLRGELHRTMSQLRLFAEVVSEGSWVQARIDRGDPNRSPLPKPELRRMLVPVGPVAVFGACNFPFAISVLGNDSVAAWAAGCPVVVKAHPGHPGTCELQGLIVQQVVSELGLPPGIFSMVQGVDHRVSRQLVTHPCIQAVGFTGSLQGGRALNQLAQNRSQPIPFFAELGSLNPVLVFPGALALKQETIARGLVASASFGHGQMCTRPGYVFYCDNDDREVWLQQLVNAAESVPANPLLTSGVSQMFDDHIEQLQAELNATLLVPKDVNVDDRAAFHLLEVNAEELSGEVDWPECFGPVTVLVRCKDVAAMTRLAESLPGGLTCSIFSEDDDRESAVDWLERLPGKFGRIVWSGFPTGVEVGHATHHGGPYPASFDGQGTSIGTASISRFSRPVCFQNVPEDLLPVDLQDANPRQILRLHDGKESRGSV